MWERRQRRPLLMIAPTSVGRCTRRSKNVVMSYSEVEKMVRTATSNEPWGASEDLRLKIADATYDLYGHARRVAAKLGGLTAPG